jgi:hypothetical protein
MTLTNYSDTTPDVSIEYANKLPGIQSVLS